MELVYLWVEDYKNIHRQGFNFSPRFRCDYNPDTNELTIEENKDYIPNFFGENINITAIVGKNGSGKSSVLEYLSNNPKFIITFENGIFQINIEAIIINLTNYNIVKKHIHLQYSIILSPDYVLNNIDKIDEEEIFLKTNLNYFENISNDEIYGLGYGYFRKILRELNVFLNSKNNLNKIIFPKHILLDFNEGICESQGKGICIYDFFENKNISLSELPYLLVYEDIYWSSNKEEYDEYFIDIVDSYFSKTFNNFSNDISLEKLFIQFEKELYNTSFIKIYKKALEYCKLFSNYDDVYPISTEGRIIYSLPIERLNPKILGNPFDVKDSFFKKFYWDVTFSSGETAFIDLLASIYHQLSNNDTLQFIYIDEGESFLHPNWQKIYLSYIIQFVKDNFPNRKLQFIITTHSPFLLSDIPKQNIIFLDTYKGDDPEVLNGEQKVGNCKVVDGLKEKKQTFGANIHTLLSDSFFMEDGLMGEFAKGKIDKVIKILNKDNLSQKELKQCEQIISIIGEPILKRQLQKMLDSKRLKKVDKIDKIEKDILELQQELKRLKNEQE